MATSEQKAFYVLQFAKTESVVTVQRAFRIKFGCDPLSDNNIHRWYHQFEDTGCLCKGKSKGRPRVSEETVERVREPFTRSAKKLRKRLQLRPYRLQLLQLKRKECQHLTMLSSEWTKRRMELEDNLNKNVEQCRALAQSLNDATDSMRERSRQNSEKERALSIAEKELERKYEMRFQELKEASNRMEAEVNHKLSLVKFEKTELIEKVGQLEREKKRLLQNIQTLETEIESVKNSGITKEQAAGLLQEMKSKEEKLEAALESKIFFKEQWGKAVREIHRLKKEHQHAIHSQLQRERDDLHKIQLSQQAKEEEKQMTYDKNVLKDLRTETQELSGQQQVYNQQFQQQNQSSFGSIPGYPPCLNLNNAQLQRLIDQRDQLLNSGAITNREMLAVLNNQIRTLLLQMST